MKSNEAAERLVRALVEYFRVSEETVPLPPPPAVPVPNRYVTVAVYAAISGLSQNAIRCKIKAGTWLEGREYIRAPDGHVMIDREGVQRWMTRGS